LSFAKSSIDFTCLGSLGKNNKRESIILVDASPKEPKQVQSLLATVISADDNAVKYANVNAALQTQKFSFRNEKRQK
jgi:hypothetical protein